MKCPFCGTETKEKKCPRCWADLKDHMTEKEVQRANQRGEQTGVPMKKNKIEQ